MKTCKYCGAGSFPEKTGVVKSCCKSWTKLSTNKTHQSSACKDRQISKLSRRLHARTMAGDAMAELLSNDLINAQTIIGKQKIPAVIEAWDKAKGKHE